MSGDPESEPVVEGSAAEGSRQPAAAHRTTSAPSPAAGQAILTGSLAIRFVIAFAITLLLGRVLPPEEFGFFAILGTILSVASGLLDMGTGSMAVREIVRSPSREQALLEGLVAWRRSGGIALAAILVVAAMFQQGVHRYVLLGAAGTLLLTGSNALYAVFQVRHNQVTPALIAVVSQAVVLVGALAMWALHLTGAAFAWLLVLRELLIIVLVRHFGRAPLKNRLVPGFAARGLRPFFSVALVHGFAVLSYTLHFHADVFLVDLVRGSSELGAYAAAFKLLNPLLAMPGILMVPLLPVFAAAAADPRQLARHVSRAAWLLVGFAILVAGLGWSLAPDLIELVYGGRYSHGELSAVAAFRWLSLAFAAVLAGSAFVAAMQADGRERSLLVLGVTGLVANVVGNLMVLPRYGFTGAAIMTFATELLICICAAWTVLRAAPEGRSWASLPGRLVVLVPGAVVVLGVSLFSSPATRLGAGAVLAGIGILCLLVSPVGRAYRGGMRSDRPGQP